MYQLQPTCHAVLVFCVCFMAMGVVNCLTVLIDKNIHQGRTNVII